MKAASLSEAETEYYLGDLLLRANRTDEAAPHLQKAVALDEQCAVCQISLGILLTRQQRLAEAKQKLEAGPALAPQNYLGHYHYANALSEEEKYAEAVKAYQRAVQLNSQSPYIFNDLGRAYLALGEEKLAEEAFNKAVQLEPQNVYLYHSRAYACLRLRLGQQAAKDALAYLQRKGWHDEHAAYIALVGHFGYRQVGKVTEAAAILNEAAAQIDSTKWPSPVFKYLKGSLTPQQLLSQSNDNDRLTESHTYLGLDLALNGKPADALAHLQWVKEKGNQNFVEYPLAVAELKRLENKK